MRPVYYNEIDPYCAEWLRNLIIFGLLPPGDVDERDIRDVRPDDLRGYRQCHFFAGLGGWAYALQLAGWPDDEPVWTGSCPCQPFSTAGRKGGFADERHLWPSWFHLIEVCRPPVVLGEQVASKDGLAWLDLVQADLEGAGYAVGAADLCAAGVGAPHIRQRLWFVADALHAGWAERRAGAGERPSAGSGGAGLVGDAGGAGPQGRRLGGDGAGKRAAGPAGVAGGVADAEPSERRAGDLQGRGGAGAALVRPQAPEEFAGDGCPDYWSDADWLPCRDGKWRPVEPGAFPLAHGVPARVGRLRAYGNAIVPQVAAAFVTAYREARGL